MTGPAARSAMARGFATPVGPSWMSGRLLISFALLVVLTSARPAVAGAVPVPSQLPRYDLALTLDVAAHTTSFRQTVIWTNRHKRPTNTLVFSFYPNYHIPKG